MIDFCLEVSVPVCSFRKPYAREYLESERFPPPSTVYGFLLSLVGEEDRYRYVGTQLALAVIKIPEVSTILRTAWRIKNKKKPVGTESNRRPDFQDILAGLEIGIWVRDGELAKRLRSIQNPYEITRFGGLSLGESRDLVNDVVYSPHWNGVRGHLLVIDPSGQYPLPVWVDHVGSAGTRWEQFRLHEMALSDSLPENAWITIQPPE